MDKNTVSLLAILGIAAGLIYAGQKSESAPEPEDDSLPTTMDSEDEALKEALGKVE